MKKITLFAFSLMLSVFAQAQTLLTQSVDPINVTVGGVACWDGTSGTYSNNSFFRVYDLADFGVSGSFLISEVQYGQGTADDGKVVTLNIYTSDSTDLTSANLTIMGSVDHISSSSDDLSLVTEEINVLIPSGSIVVFELNAPDSGTNTGETFFPGINEAGENDDSYLQAVDCGLENPNTTTSIGFPDNQYVMNVLGDEILSVVDNLSEVVSVYPNPASTVLNVKVPSNIEINRAYLIDVFGKTIEAVYSNGEMNVSGIAAGIYILKLETNFGFYIQKVLKQ